MTIRQSPPSSIESAELTSGNEQDCGFELIGRQLAEMRKQQELSILQVTEATGITSANLRLLEAGTLQTSLAPAYVKGYIKCYAKALNLPLEELLQAYQQGFDTECKGGEESWHHSGKKQFTYKLVAAVTILVFIVALAFFFVSPVQSNSLKGKTEAAIAQQYASDRSVSLTADNLMVAPVIDSWIEITDSEGSILKADLMPAGDDFLVQGCPPFKLIVGHGGQVVVNYLEQSIHLTADSGDNTAAIVLGPVRTH